MSRKIISIIILLVIILYILQIYNNRNNNQAKSLGETETMEGFETEPQQPQMVISEFNTYQPLKRDVLLLNNFDTRTNVNNAQMISKDFFIDELNGGFTFSFWIRLDQCSRASRFSHIFHKGDYIETKISPGFWVDNKEDKIYVGMSTTTSSDEGFIIPIDFSKLSSKFTHFAFVVGSNKAILYCDKQKLVVFQYKGNTIFNKGDLYLGKTLKNSGFNGCIMNLMYSNYKMTQNDVTEAYKTYNPFIEYPCKLCDDC